MRQREQKQHRAGGLVTLIATLAWLIAVASGCADMMAGSYDLGATPGGAQDIGLAREIIESGGVPQVSQFTVEGLFSEHDLTLASPAPCDQVLCLGAAAGLEVGLDDGQRDIFVQLGMSSNIQADSFERQPLNLGIVIDASGSMSGELDALKEALHALVDNLRSDDRVAIVVFEATAVTVQPSTLASDASALHAAVDRLRTGGSTNMEAGMRLGYAEIDDHVDAEHLSRLMVFTDAQTNTGSTDAGSFGAMTQAAAARGIGFTFFGFGMYFSAEFVDAIAHLRGGNYRFVRSEDVQAIFEEELDFLVTPIAYDLRVSLQAPAAAPRVAVYGIPQPESHDDGKLFEVTTVFLSRRKGGIVLRFDGSELEGIYADGALQLGTAEISYDTLDGEEIRLPLDLNLPLASLPAADAVHYPDAPIQRTLAVTDQYLAMHRVCAAYYGVDATDYNAQPRADFDAAEAGQILDQAIAKLTDADALLEDPNLQREIAMLEQLRTNLGAGE